MPPLLSISWPSLAGNLFVILYAVTAAGLAFVIISENRNPLKTLPWVVVLLLLPVIGLVFYFFFGQDNRKLRIISRHTYKRIVQPPQTRRMAAESVHVPEAYRPLAALLKHKTPLLYGSDIRIYTHGPEKFEALVEALEQARHHIHFQYYIFMDDEIGERVKQILMRKAREGVEVRVMYDDVGCWKVKKRFFEEMKAAGVEVYPFLKVAFPILTSKVNYRNHRKVVVIDGKVGFMGGMNVADRYVKGTPWGAWRDTHFKFTGQGVYGLQTAFLIDWYVVSKKLLGNNDNSYYPKVGTYSDTLVQVLTSGPIGPWRSLLQAIIFMISNAKKYIYIQTPYFLPTEGLNQALQAAALGGVDVRLMLPARSDTRSANIASHSYLDDVMKAGVKVFFYQPGFLHAKSVVVDDALACIGSANMDFRSFEHNFEINAFVYQAKFALRMKKIFLDDQHDCKQLKLSLWRKRPVSQRVAESFMRLFSPLL
ncbi:MAG: cardiolipin synthase [Tannerella sp.]|jgi:cardiolipin synthase|nr:cardiolipin synthase [Tannerella sp.]